jgi:hypothetical protein
MADEARQIARPRRIGTSRLEKGQADKPTRQAELMSELSGQMSDQGQTN